MHAHISRNKKIAGNRDTFFAIAFNGIVIQSLFCKTDRGKINRLLLF
jgi:hypothetical protein